MFNDWMGLQTFLGFLKTTTDSPSITPTNSPSNLFARLASSSPTPSQSSTFTQIAFPTRSAIPNSLSNSPSRTVNLSPSLSGTPSNSVPALNTSSVATTIVVPISVSNTPTLSVTATNTPSISNSASVVTTPTETRTSFFTLSNSQSPNRNLPSPSITPSRTSNGLTLVFTQPSNSQAALVQFNIFCIGYCTGNSATRLQQDVSSKLQLNLELVRIIGVHELFEGDSEVTLLICSNKGVDSFLSDVQSGTYKDNYFASISVESVDWSVKCDLDFYQPPVYNSVSSSTLVLPSILIMLCIIFF